MIVNSSNATEVDSIHWEAEASTLGILPGQWPESIQTDLGNSMPFLKEKNMGLAVRYLQVMGSLTLLVYND